jgi:uncharacterized protein (DUF58 family)
MASYLVKVRKKMDIHSMHRVRNVLTGNYGSVFKGRSMDFDDLREYSYGDDVKDIDWKATARSRSVMIRRYIAVRKHNILIVADNGNSMATLAPSGEPKSEVATFCAGVMAYVAQHHSDLIGMVYGNMQGNVRYAMKEDTAYLENFLSHYAQSISIDNPESNINGLLTYIAKGYRERLFIIVITDPDNAETIDSEIIRKLNARHEQMFILIEDSPMTNTALHDKEVRDIDGKVRLPHFYRKNKSLAKAEKDYRDAQKIKIKKALHHFHIASTFIGSSDQAVPAIVRMLEEQKHARRK